MSKLQRRVLGRLYVYHKNLTRWINAFNIIKKSETLFVTSFVRTVMCKGFFSVAHGLCECWIWESLGLCLGFYWCFINWIHFIFLSFSTTLSSHLCVVGICTGTGIFRVWRFYLHGVNHGNHNQQYYHHHDHIHQHHHHHHSECCGLLLFVFIFH